MSEALIAYLGGAGVGLASFLIGFRMGRTAGKQEAFVDALERRARVMRDDFEQHEQEREERSQ